MMRYYDASALVKRYVEEPGSQEVRHLMQLDRHPITGAASGAEVPAALARAMRAGRLQVSEAQSALAHFQRDWERSYLVIPLNSVAARRAGELAWRHALRGYDSVHLAAALIASEIFGSAVEVVSYDRELAQAAQAEGLAVRPGAV
ncbi:MAG: type II toxin-antitoxin system VapC family toxin [Anaerolineae bacterium]